MGKFLGRKHRSERGFAFMSFHDLYGEPCSIQESSLADRGALWLGCEHETIHQVTGQKCGARMHLDVKLAKKVVNTLNRWIETGKL